MATEDQTRPDWAERIRRFHEDYGARNVSACVVSNPRNLTYLCGFSGSAGLLIGQAGRARLLLDGRYETAARGAQAHGEIGPVDIEGAPRSFQAAFAELLARTGVHEIGFEAEHITVASLHAWQKVMPDVTWVPLERLIEQRRLIKDAHEIAILRRAARLLSEVADNLRALVVPGRTEREVARAIDDALERAGFASPAFPTIVASGPNSAHPHARPTDRRLSGGDLVLLDFGGVIDGYCGDLTRMAVIGAAEPGVRRLFDAVRDAQAAAIDAVRPGRPASDVDAAARGVLERCGFGEAFVHATGHGLGLDLHEAPRVARADADPGEVLEAGMVFTVEPGAYVDGLGGVRLEDDVLVTTAGCEALTRASRDLIVV